MQIETWKWLDHPQYHGKEKLWNASILGPWYGDSNPTGSGDTQEEAVSDVLKITMDLIIELENLLRDPSITRGVDQV